MSRVALLLLLWSSAAMLGAPEAKTVSPEPGSRSGKTTPDLTKAEVAIVNHVRMSRVVIQPNGWGNNPASARRDLDRVMRFYERRPGFRRDRYVKIIEIGRGKFQCDGRCSYLAPVRH